MYPYVEQLARVYVDDEQRLEPDALGGLHGEEVDGPERILCSRTHTVKGHLFERPGREAVLGEDAHDCRLAYAYSHAA